MPEHVPILIWCGVVLPAVLVVACAIGFAGYRFGLRIEIRQRHHAPGRLGVLSQRRSGPHRECVELTAAERAAFAGLVRRLSDGH
jgi:hypothetical protein